MEDMDYDLFGGLFEDNEDFERDFERDLEAEEERVIKEFEKMREECRLKLEKLDLALDGRVKKCRISADEFFYE